MDPKLEVCIVGSRALFEGCRRAEFPLPPEPEDLDLSWCLDPDQGKEFLANLGLESGAQLAAERAVGLCPRIAETPAGRRALALGLDPALLGQP